MVNFKSLVDWPYESDNLLKHYWIEVYYSQNSVLELNKVMSSLNNRRISSKV